jgi:cupin fold WbuC family metalloprotein
MFLLLGGDSEIGAAAYRYLKREGRAVKATTRRRDAVSPERPYFDILSSLDDWTPPPQTAAACIFLGIPRLRDCAADPAQSALTNVTQSLRLIDKLLAKGIFVLFLSTNQVFDGELANVGVDAPLCPVSEYGRQKAEVEEAIRERMAQGAPIAILRLSKVMDFSSPLIAGWMESLLNGDPIQAFSDMTVAPVPMETAIAAIGALLEAQLSGVFQLTGPRDVTYADVGSYLAKQLDANPDLVEMVSTYSAGMPEGSTPRNTTLDSHALRERFGIVVPDVFIVLSSFLEDYRNFKVTSPQLPSAKLIALDDLSEVADGVYYSRYPLPLIDTDVIAFLKQAAARSPLRRARFCAHLSPDAEQHDMLIVSHRDTYVTPHRHLSRSETFVVLEGFAEVILFDEQGEVEKSIKMGPPASGRPFFYRMPPRQFHSMLVESELLVSLESTKGPFDLSDREHAIWAPDYKDSDGGRAFIETMTYKGRDS